MRVEPMLFPLKAPPVMLPDIDADAFTMRNNYGNVYIISAVKLKIKKYMGR